MGGLRSSRQIDHDWRDIPAGDYLIGGNDADEISGDGEGPARTVDMSMFKLAAATVTNAQFAAFVNEAGYATDAERLGWSFVFHTFVRSRALRAKARRIDGAPWWLAIEGACWRWPPGRGSHVANLQDHPVVQVSWNDAQAYCRWSGARLPTEAQCKVAARGGLVAARYPWGDELMPEGEHRCNIWQGEFPHRDLADDGFHGTAPVRSYAPNGYGLFEMAGNVWEWCEDWFTTELACREGANPSGPKHGSAKVIRGGSFLCHASYCNRYRTAARTSNTIDSASSNMGFRVVAGCEAELEK